MEDIGKMAWARAVVEKADYIIAFVRKHQFTRNFMRNCKAIADRELVKAGEMDMVRWWNWHGTDHPALTALACRVLSQAVSAAACERNWAVWDSVHTTKSNRLGLEKCRDLVYVAHNWHVVHNWYKKEEGLGVVAGNIPEPPMPEGYNVLEEEAEEGEDDVLEDEYE
ncbi:hypothetical protein CLOM_g7059 [Closterium sp. NIES-68]|nr:hypothetical protein CLOM_g7059 [Closterium sp. NIES-68]